MGKLFLGMALKWWLIIALVGAVIGGGVYVYNNIKDKGAQEVTTKIEDQNDALDNHVTQVNEDITRRVTNEDIRITRTTHEIEDVINESPDEPLSNVSRARLERVRDDQRSVSKTD